MMQPRSTANWQSLAFAPAYPPSLAVRHLRPLGITSFLNPFRRLSPSPSTPLRRSLHRTPPSAMEPTHFKASHDLSFVRRQRFFSAPSVSCYSVDRASIALADLRGATAITARLVSPDASRPSLRLALWRHDHDIFRVCIDDDVTPSHVRPPTPDVLVPAVRPLPLGPSWFTVGDTQITVKAPGDASTHVVISLDPFSLALHTSSGPQILLNGEDRLYIEDFSSRPGDDYPSPEYFREFADPNARGPESAGVDFAFPFASALHGLPERTVSFALPDTVDAEPYRLYNLDVAYYELDSPFGLYGTVPLVFGRDSSGRSAGVFWLNASETYVDVRSPGAGRSTHWFSESGVVDAFLLPGPTPREVWNQYLFLTGAPLLQQRFVLGYHQCRYSYLTEADARAVDDGFDRHDIPYDVLWLDIDHTDGKKYFTWDYDAYPEPAKLMSDLAAKGKQVVTIIDPHIKVDTDYSIYQMANEEDLFIKDSFGKPFTGKCWPGKSGWLDFFSARVRERWASRFSAQNYTHFAPNLHIWNDMNEPSVFDGPERTLPKDLLHGDVEHRHLHNAYGHAMVRATHAGLVEGKDRKQRPFILTRSFFAGTQQYAAVWTGDNTADWGHLRASVPMLLTLQLSGIACAGADVGGFFDDATPELATRWFQAAAFQPFFRGHSNKGTARAEPWVYEQPWTGLIRAAIRTRYEFLPMWYTLTAAASLGSGAGFEPRWIGPAMRPVWWEFNGSEEDELAWMVGRALLVAPVMHEGVRTHKVRLPEGRWYDLLHPERPGQRVCEVGEMEMEVDAGRMVVLQRGGTVIARAFGDVRNAEDAAKQMGLMVAADEDGKAEGEVFVDDGKSYGYEVGAFVTGRVSLEGGVVRGRRTGGAEGYQGGEAAVVKRVTIVGVGEVTAVEMDGQRIEARYDAEGDSVTVDGVEVGLWETWEMRLMSA